MSVDYSSHLERYQRKGSSAAGYNEELTLEADVDEQDAQTQTRILFVKIT